MHTLTDLRDMRSKFRESSFATEKGAEGGMREREGGERKRNERLIPFLHVSAAIVAQRIRFLILWKKHARVSRSHV